MTEFHTKKCLACQMGTPPLTASQTKEFLTKLQPGWHVQDNHHLEKEFHFPNFKEALNYTVQIGTLAEQEGHHPDIYLSWGKVRVSIWTHKINGLSENDFILAAKIDRL